MADLATDIYVGLGKIQFHDDQSAYASKNLLNVQILALQLDSKTSSTTAQMEHCLQMMRTPVFNPERFERIWREHAYALADAYTMNE